MKMTMTDGTVFEGSMAEYAELLAFAKAQQAEELKVGSPETDVVATEGESAETSFDVGEFIVGLGGKYAITNEGMTLGKVVSGSVRGTDNVRVEVLTHSTWKDRIGRTYSVQSKYFRKATTEEIAQYEKAVADASKPKLKAGDTVVFTENKHEHKAGKIAIIRKIEGDGTNIVSVALNDLNGNHTGYADVSVLRKATAEEVAKHRESEKWAYDTVNGSQEFAWKVKVSN